MKLGILLLFHLALGANKICPQGSFTCSDKATCCELPNKSYGCCPIKDAVCCDDHIHCCPPGHKCSVGMCIKASNMTLENDLIGINNVYCPDGQVCPDDTTCCKSDTEVYGCCPFKDAICCADGRHCCPSGSSCNIKEGKCDGDRFSTQMYDSRKIPKVQNVMFSSIKSSEKVHNVICPDKVFQCPDAHTCCQLPNGHWGCCPFVNAVCCADHLHCCPANMKCSATSEYCSAGNNNITSVHHIPATRNDKDIICSNTTRCQDGMTCCELPDQRFGCCQYPNATCCSDHLHCCPSGSQCNVRRKKCVPQRKFLLLQSNYNMENEI